MVINVSFTCDEKGDRYLDPMWAKDLTEHFRYLKNFTLAAPCQQETSPGNAIVVTREPSFSNVKADIVHSCVAGWPIPMGWLVTPIALIQGKFYVLAVESAPWPLEPGTTIKIKDRIIAYLSEIVNRWCVNNANLTIFTQSQYQQSLLTKRQERGHVIHASWIDEENIISEADAEEIWHKKLSPSTQKLKLLFAGRVESSKGVLVLLEAMKILDKKNIAVNLDILGDGTLLSECKILSNQLQKSVNIQILGTIAYGKEFFRLLQEYHAIVVPILSEEQPRIVYDAYSQAVPILASNTDRLRDCIHNHKTGVIVNSNDPVALADLIEWSGQNLPQLQSMGKASLQQAHSMTHQEMHRSRWQLLLMMLQSSKV
ncbi:glycosyltransferase [Microcoleus sp. MOSTC5]|uniref:glycosyltransferase n=1 Tax=Microcoleus sp. MOSTC5 TaxID=3055378 RepID=UPI002FD2F3EF